MKHIKLWQYTLGVRGRDDLLYLNLHEKAPRTPRFNSGNYRVEVRISSIIYFIAMVNYHPYEVKILLIDYKGIR